MVAFQRFLGSRLGLAAMLAIAAVIDYLLWNHSRNVWAAAAPYLLIVACPLTHLFGHRHGHAAPKAEQEECHAPVHVGSRIHAGNDRPRLGPGSRW